jgi:hypothetical protein
MANLYYKIPRGSEEAKGQQCDFATFWACRLLKKRRTVMAETKSRAVVESLFDRNQRRDVEIEEALKQQANRLDAAVNNMYRFRVLRLAREGAGGVDSCWSQ